VAPSDPLSDLDGDRPSRLFAIDRGWDRTAASDGNSRYGVYLGHHVAALGDALDDHPLDLVALLWRIAQPPSMTPGYVQCSSRVRDNDLWRDEIPQDSGGCTWGLRASVRLAYRSPTPGWSDWTTDLSKKSWQPPADNRRPGALCTIRYDATLPLGPDIFGPAPDLAHKRALTRWAEQAVAALVASMNQTFDALTDAVAVTPIPSGPHRRSEHASALGRWADNPLGPDPYRTLDDDRELGRGR
jgi:hypothetical protein